VTKDGSTYITNPNKFVDVLPDYIPKNVDSILIFGCTNGRDFIPFLNKGYKLYGTDLNSPDEIYWVDEINSNQIKYYQSTLSSFMKILTENKEFTNMSNFLVLSHFVLTYDWNSGAKIVNEIHKRGGVAILLLKNHCLEIINQNGL
jgi:hypothetical protein